MRFDWSMLGGHAPTALVRARHLAHHAAQWPTRAARANLAPASDDSHASLAWDSEHAALMSQALPVRGADVRIGLRIAGLELIVMRGGVLLDNYTLEGRTEAMTGVWFDSALRALGLEPASGVTLPYTLPFHPVAKRAPYGRSAEAEALAELARWYDAADDLLREIAGKLASLRPGPGPARCWPHHFDIATLVSLAEGAGETTKSIGIGLSPGDEHYAQPYVYVSPWPHLPATGLPDCPPPGHWHTHGFVAAVATADEILALEDRGSGLLVFVEAAVEIGRERLAA